MTYPLSTSYPMQVLRVPEIPAGVRRNCPGTPTIAKVATVHGGSITHFNKYVRAVES